MRRLSLCTCWIADAWAAEEEEYKQAPPTILSEAKGDRKAGCLKGGGVVYQMWARICEGICWSREQRQAIQEEMDELHEKQTRLQNEKDQLRTKLKELRGNLQLEQWDVKRLSLDTKFVKEQWSFKAPLLQRYAEALVKGVKAEADNVPMLFTELRSSCQMIHNEILDVFQVGLNNLEIT
ncbi:hypothetical protein KP509_09G066300 [Ceratopteris richardii]|uniref:Uncharacterized protein n=1 Tax=Ceratopteris richardii TaxID=49495 RepID=A0A8T2U226_CERRI|nr:hypothetical protein KP509_09G066300 [Ceratopteris richardii]